MKHGLAIATVVSCLLGGACPKNRPRRPDTGVVVDTKAAEMLKAATIRRKAVLETNAEKRAALVQRLPFAELVSLPICFTPPQTQNADIDVDRSLFVHDRATLDGADFGLGRTLGQIANQTGVPGLTGADVFRELWDTQNLTSQAATPAIGAHCDDDGNTINGFDVSCRPQDGAQAKAADLDAEMTKYTAIGLVNRLDLAGEGWRNCGEHRIVYGRQGGPGRSLIIFEAVLPNPRPGCRSGCRPVATFWKGLSSIADPGVRAEELEKFYFQGLPGFRPVVHVDHYAATGGGGTYGSAGSGQVRTNQFIDPRWMLKEFKLALDCSTSPCALDVVPIEVKLNPFGMLWSQEAAASGTFSAKAQAFQADVLAQVANLADADINKFSYAVDVDHDAAESDEQQSNMPDNYRSSYNPAGAHTPGQFRAELAAVVPGHGLTEAQLVNRATALSCAGCHQPGTFGLTGPNAIGPGMTWPASASFVHVRETAVAGVHALSPALTGTFLPAREAFLLDFLNARACWCRFLPLKRPRLVTFEARLFQENKAERDRLLTEIAAPSGASDKRRARAAEEASKKLAVLERRVATELATEAKKEGAPSLPSVTVDLAPSKLSFDGVKAVARDPKKVAAARRSAVRALLRTEPVRKTVTGHFRVH